MKTFLIAVAAALLVVMVSGAQAQKYPSRPIRIIVPFSAGSQSDVLARMIGPRLSETCGQQVVVDNRPSAGGVVAGGIVAGATPDGHAGINIVHVAADVAKLAQVAKAAGIKID